MNTFFKVWMMPIALGLLIAFGLLSALLATGIWHWLSWLSLTIPVVTVIYYLQYKKRLI